MNANIILVINYSIARGVMCAWDLCINVTIACESIISSTKYFIKNPTNPFFKNNTSLCHLYSRNSLFTDF
jgi:hypothetical protein